MEEPSTFDRLPWPRHTRRLLLRPVAAADLPRVFAIRSLPEVARWMTAAPVDEADFVAAFGQPARMSCTLVVETDGLVVGDLYLAVSDAWGQYEVADDAKSSQAEIGWCVDPSYAGRGIATEGAAELLRICFDGLGLRRVTAGAFAANTASLRVMERIGMTIEGRGRLDSLHRELGWVDGVSAAVLAEEWRAPGPDPKPR